MSFNHELIERTQRYYLTKTGVTIDESTTIDYLNQLADLYVSFEAFAQQHE